MLNASLEKYLVTCQSTRIPFEQVARSLMSAGYTTTDIIGARNWYAAHPFPSPSNPPAAPDKPISLELHHTPGARIPMIAISILIIALIFLSTAFFAIATEKVQLPDKKLQQQIRMAYYRLPGVPKSPKIVLEQAMDAHKQVFKNSFDLSISIQGITSEVQKVIGASSLDVALAGFVDYADTTNPKFNLSFLAGKDLDVEVRKKDATMYLQIPKVPPYLYLSLGLEPDKLKPLLANWISFDTTPLETEASKKLADINKEEKSQSLNQQTTQDILRKLLNENIYPLLSMSSETLDNQPVYKIQFKPTSAQLDTIAENVSRANAQSQSPLPKYAPDSTYKPPKMSEYLRNLEVLVYVGKNDAYVHRLDVSFRVETSGLSSSSVAATMPIPGVGNSNKPIDVVAVLKLSGFGNDVPISIPDTALTQEEFYQKLMELKPGGLFGGMGSAMNTARNTQRRADINAILNAVTMYQIDKGVFPSGITTTSKPISKKGADLCTMLIPTYLASMPFDPSLNNISIVDCQADYDTGYTIVKNSAGEIIIQAPLAENSETIVVQR